MGIRSQHIRGRGIVSSHVVESVMSLVIHVGIKEYIQEGSYGQVTFMDLSVEAPADILCSKYVLCTYSSTDTSY